MVTPQQVIFPRADGLRSTASSSCRRNAAAGRSPALVFFHGGSRRQMLLGWHYMYYYSNAYAMNQYLANRGYIVLSVNYRSGIGYGLDFREALNYGPAGGSEYNDVQGAGMYLRGRAPTWTRRASAPGADPTAAISPPWRWRARRDLFSAGVDFHGVHDWATELGIPAGEPDYKVAFESSPHGFRQGRGARRSC